MGIENNCGISEISACFEIEGKTMKYELFRGNEDWTVSLERDGIDLVVRGKTLKEVINFFNYVDLFFKKLEKI